MFRAVVPKFLHIRVTRGSFKISKAQAIPRINHNPGMGHKQQEIVKLPVDSNVQTSLETTRRGVPFL